MGTSYVMATLAGNTSGEFQGIDYTEDLEAINANLGFIKQAIDALTLSLNTDLFGVTASTTPGSAASSALRIATYLKADGKIAVDGNKKQAEGLAALGTIAKQLAGLSSTLAAGVATNQIIAADQIKKNAFDKEATQVALARNKLPAVTVTSQGFLQTIQTTVQDATAIASQASATGFVTSTATNAIGSASTYVVDLLPSFGDITNQFKSLKFGKLADTEGEAKRVEAEILLEA
jgi:hypothetical protein